MKPIIYSQTEVRNVADELAPILWQGRQWAVTEAGIHQRDGTYLIKKGQLGETRPDVTINLLAHMGEKEWLDREDFATAFFVALTLHGTKHNFTREDFAEGVKELFRYAQD